VTLLSETQARVSQLFDRDGDMLEHDGRSIVLSHGERRPNAAVLLHGMTASPKQFIEIAEALHASNYNVIVPRLPRHGHRDRLTEVLIGLSTDELKSVARDALEFARGLGDRVTVIGFSVGGLLAAWVAQHYAIERAVCIAPFLGVAWLPATVSNQLARMALRLPNRFGWWDPIRKARQMPAHGYPRFSTHAIARAQRFAAELMQEARATAPRASSIVLVTNSREMTVNNAQVRKLTGRWRNHPATKIETFEFDDLPFCHDIIEPLRHPGVTARVYPKLLDLIIR